MRLIDADALVLKLNRVIDEHNKMVCRRSSMSWNMHGKLWESF